MEEITWGTYLTLNEKVLQLIKDKQYKFIVAVSRGGLVPASLIAYRLGIETIYNFGILKDGTIYQNPFASDIPVADADFIIVDDTLETGETMKKVLEEARRWIELNKLKVNYDALVVTTKKKNRIYGINVNTLDKIIFPYKLPTKFIVRKPNLLTKIYERTQKIFGKKKIKTFIKT